MDYGAVGLGLKIAEVLIHFCYRNEGVSKMNLKVQAGSA
jgi:hypothetical protein